MKVEEGDLVKLKNIRGDHWNSNGRMDHFCGKTVRVNSMFCDSRIFTIVGEDWTFDLNDVVAIIKRGGE